MRDGARELARADIGADHRHHARRPARTSSGYIRYSSRTAAPNAGERRGAQQCRHSPSAGRARRCSASAAATSARRRAGSRRTAGARSRTPRERQRDRCPAARRGRPARKIDEAVKDDDRGDARAGDAERRHRPPAEHQQRHQRDMQDLGRDIDPGQDGRPGRCRARRWSAHPAASRRRRRRRSRWNIRVPPRGSAPRPPSSA